ncbi:MAG TPA: hypothetical protein VMQ93_20900 [Novosphingobium sp.]|nr:hypothetical protein [Novosphingobium sp.]
MKLGGYRTLLLLISLSCGSLGCDSVRDAQAEIEAGCPGLKDWEPSTAVEDAKLAVKQGDKRLLAVMGVALVVPDGYNVDVVKITHKIVVIRGTTDAIRNETCRIMNDRAFEYAEKYNQVIMGQ